MFEGARLKTERADKHIRDLELALNKFIELGIGELVVERDVDAGNKLLKFRQTKETPADIPLILGDALHNIRSALDYAYCEIVRDIAGVTLRPKTQIKIVQTREECIASLTTGDGVLKGAPVIAAIVADVLKPYKTGNEGSPLHAIHALNVTDKHIILIPTISATAIKLRNVRFGGLAIEQLELVTQGGGVFNIASIGGANDMELKYDFESANFSVGFGKYQPLEGQHILPTMKKFTTFAFELIGELEAELAALKQR